MPRGVVDADGDIAVRIDRGTAWDIEVADPRPDAPEPLAVVTLADRIAGTSSASRRPAPASIAGSSPTVGCPTT